MPLVVGHSQTKYLSEYLCRSNFSVFAFPGARAHHILEKDYLFEVAEYHSVIVVVVGANDIGSTTPECIVAGIEKLCKKLHEVCGATIIISEVLPRAQNGFANSRMSLRFINDWNREAGLVNNGLRNLSQRLRWLRIIKHPDFHTLLGARRNLLSRDGLHLSFEGTKLLATSIEAATRHVIPTSSIPLRHSQHTRVRKDQVKQPEPERWIRCHQHGHPKPIPRPSAINVENRFSVLPIEESDDVIISVKATTAIKRKQRIVKRQRGGNLTDSEQENEDSQRSYNVYQTGIDQPLSIEHAKSILHQCVNGELPIGKINNFRPIKPVGGDVVIIDTMNMRNKMDRRCDDYQWHNDGCKKVPRKLPTVCQTRFRIRVKPNENEKAEPSSEFARTEHKLIENDRYYIMHYLGNEKCYVPCDHGNRKNLTNKQTSVRTCPSVMDIIREEASSNIGTAKIYKDLATSVDGEQALSEAPKNKEQVKKVKQYMQEKKRLSQDDIYSSLLLSYQLDGFVHQIDLFPSLTIVMGMQESIDNLNSLLNIDQDNKVVFSIDTTFECGNFYVTPLLYKNFIFKKEPTTPVAFMIHEKKDQKFHERFISILLEKCPNLGKKDIVFIADREAGITNAIETKLNNAKVYHCWNHVKRDVREWLRQRKTPTSNVELYMNNLDQLLRCVSENEFQQLLEDLSGPWCESFGQYFECHIKTDIVKYSGRWILEQAGIYNEKSGITSNMSEGFNTVIKYMNDHKRMSVAGMILSLFYLQNSIHVEMLRGRAGLGDQELKSDFSYSQIPLKDLKFPHSIVKENEIFNIVQTAISEIEEKSKNENNETTEKQDTQEDLANKVLSADGVRLVSEMNAFMVCGLRDKKYTVTLFPKEECQCPATGTCYHIIAAKRSIGIKITEKKEERKLISLMRYKNRPKTQRRIGQKKQKPSDFENIVPAPDSKLAKSIDNDEVKNNSPPNSPAPKVKKIKVESPLAKSEDKYSPQYETPSKRLKLPKITSPSFTDILQESPTSVFRDEFHTSVPWLPELDLTMHDKEIIETNQWLNDKHMNAVNKILSKQFKNIQGLQDTKMTPFYVENDKTWNTFSKFQRATPPCTQMHFDGNCHWTCSFSNEAGCVYYLDSMSEKLKHLKFNVQIQLCQIYNTSDLSVKLPRIQQQPNNYDCGLFAIANTVEFCYHPNKFNFNVMYKIDEMREHLSLCLENGSISPFPKEDQKIRSSAFTGIPRVVKLEKRRCVCGMPDFIEDIVGCNNRKCNKWYHLRCVGLSKKRPISGWKWECLTCKTINT